MDVKISLPLLPLRDIVVFPSMVIPLFVGRDKSISALNEVHIACVIAIVKYLLRILLGNYVAFLVETMLLPHQIVLYTSLHYLVPLEKQNFHIDKQTIKLVLHYLLSNC